MIKSAHIYITQYAKHEALKQQKTSTPTYLSRYVNMKILTVLWNQVIQTNREVLANRPDIIIKNKKDKICLLIDVAVLSVRNVIQKEFEKKLKYKNLSIEIQRIWNMKCFVIPVIIGATGIVTKGLKDIWKQYRGSIQ
jgi:hypothetical protein